jgi:hypothetical protein
MLAAMEITCLEAWRREMEGVLEGSEKSAIYDEEAVVLL